MQLAATGLLVAAAAFVAVDTLQQPTVGPPGSAHIHAHLLFHADGGRIPVTPAFPGTDRVHFHADDGVVHVHATGVTLGHALSALNVSAADGCLALPSRNGTRCGNATHTVRVAVNGRNRTVQAALDHRIQQGDTIVLYHGPRDRALPQQYRNLTLPERYRPDPPGQQV